MITQATPNILTADQWKSFITLATQRRKYSPPTSWTGDGVEAVVGGNESERDVGRPLSHLPGPPKGRTAPLPTETTTPSTPQAPQPSCQSLRRHFDCMAKSYLREACSTGENLAKVEEVTTQRQFFEQVLSSWESGARLEESIHSSHESFQRLLEDVKNISLQTHTMLIQNTHIVLGNHMANILQALENAINLQQEQLLNRLFDKGVLNSEDILKLKLLDRENTRKRNLPARHRDDQS